MSVEQNPDLWQQLETYTAQSRSAYNRLDDALNRLDPSAERESKAELEGLFAKVRVALEGLQTHHPRDRRIKDALKRFDRWQEQSRRPPGVLLTADARSTLERLEKMMTPAMPQPSIPAARAAERKKRGRPVEIPDDRKEQAQRAKDSGQSNRECARILYVTLHPSERQVKNVTSILNHYRKKRRHPQNPHTESQA